tara:strand:- start:2211 stop:4517 length:2307 start_codon:yes stop_codon:yes gene_type:complete
MANKKAERVKQLFNRLRSHHRDQWLFVNQKGHDFSNDNQLTEAEKKALEDQGMPSFTINRITPVVEMLNYYATANSPRWQAIGTEGSDIDVAAVFSDMADYIWSSSNGQALLSNAINDSVTKSLGYLHITVNSDADNGMGEVVIHQPDPFDVFVDPKSRDTLFRDASYIMIKKMLPKSHLKKLYPDQLRKIKKASANDSEYSLSQRVLDGEQKDILQTDITYAYDSEGKDEPLVEYFELYEKVKAAFINVFYKIPPEPQALQQAQEGVKQQIQKMQERMQVEMLEQKQQMDEALQSGSMLQERYDLEMKNAQEMMQQQLQTAQKQMMQDIEKKMSVIENKIVSEREFKVISKNEQFASTIVDTVRFHDNRIRTTVVVGDQLIYEKILPENIKDYPIIPFHYKWIGTPYPISAVAPLVGKQRELNKAHQLMIHNASLGSSLRWMYYEGSIDAETWEKYSSSPGALLPVNHGYDQPQAVMPAQLSNAFFSIVQNGKGDMEYLAGIYSAMQGDTQATADMPYRGMLAMDEYGTRRVKYWLKHSIEPALAHVGEIVKQFSQATYTAHKVFRVVQPTGLEDDRQVEINKTLYNDLGVAIGKYHDYATAKFDIRMIGGSTMPVNRWAYLQELKELANSGIIDPQAVLAESDIRNKAKIAERMDKVKQLEGQIGGLEGQVKDKDGTIQTLERQLVQLGIKDKVRSAETEIDKKKHETKGRQEKQFLETEAMQKNLRNIMKVELDGKRKSMDSTLKDFSQKLSNNLQKDLQNNKKQ